MDVHKNARSCPASRELLARRVLELGWSTQEAAEAAGLSVRRAREWVRRARAGEPLTDRSSRPHRVVVTPALMIDHVLALRREWRTVRQIAKVVVRSHTTVARICRAAGMSRLRQLEPQQPVVRYECDRPGELLHLDIKRLGRFNAVGHRITRTRSHGGPRQGWEFVHVAIDDASRVSYAEILADESGESAAAFLKAAVAWFAAIGVPVQRVLTDNGSGYLSMRFRDMCAALAIKHSRTRPYTPRTNGKAERFIQTMLREWAYRFSYDTSAERRRWLRPFLHFYNRHRSHSALGYNPPFSRLDRNNLPGRNS